MTERDFKVKAGLVVEGDATLKGGDGAVTFPAASSIKMVDGSATALVIEEANTAYLTFHTTDSGEKIQLHKALDIDAASDFGSNAMTNVNIDSGTIDSTPINSSTIGATSQAAGYFTTLDATNTFEARATGSAIRTAGKLCVNEPDVDTSTIPTRTQAAIYGKTLAQGGTMSDGSTTVAATDVKDYVELLLQTDAPEGDIDGYVANYVGNAVVLDNVENVPTTGQGTIYSVGASGSGDSWGIGRAGGVGGGSFQIGYKNQSWVKSHAGSGNAMMPAQSMLDIDTSGNMTLNKAGATLSFTSNTDVITSFVGSGSASAAAYTLPPAHAAANDYVLTAQTNGVLAWAASASGADGMGAGFQLEDDDGTEVAITTSKEVKFIGAGITTNWTNTSNGTNADPYDMTFTLDVDDLGTSANFAAGDLIAFGDSSTAGNDTVKGTVDTLATLFAGTGLDASSAVISLDLDGLTDIGADLVGADLIIVDDGANGTTKKATLTRLGALLAGGNISADTGVLSVATASATAAGIVELATIAETNTGTDAARAVTPDGLADWTGGNSAITKLGTIATGVWNGTKVASAYLDDDTAHLTTTQTFSGAKTFSASVDMNAGATIDGTTISLDATTSLNIDNSNTTNGISIGTATSGVPVTIGHGTSEVTFGDNVTITGNLTVNGDQTVINTTAIVAEDKSMILGIAGGMEDATFARSGAVVTITSTSHGMANGESVYVSNMGNSITDGVYTVSSVATNTFVLDSHGTSGTVGAGATMQHSSANVTESTADGSGIFAPGTSLHSIQYDSSNGWTVGDDLDITSGHHLSFAGVTTLTATALGSNVVSSSLTSVGTLSSLLVGNLSISGATIGHSTDTDLITLASTAVTLANNVDFNVAKAGGLQIAGAAVTSSATELNLVDGCSAGAIVNSKAAITSSAGQVNGTTLGVNSVSVLAVNSSDSAASSSGAAITVFSMDKTVYRAAKVVLSVELLTTGAAAASKYEMMEILVHFDGSAAHHTTYAHMSTNATDLAAITTAVSGDNVLIKYDPVGTDTDNFKFRVAATQLVL